MASPEPIRRIPIADLPNDDVILTGPPAVNYLHADDGTFRTWRDSRTAQKKWQLLRCLEFAWLAALLVLIPHAVGEWNDPWTHLTPASMRQTGLELFKFCFEVELWATVAGACLFLVGQGFAWFVMTLRGF